MTEIPYNVLCRQNSPAYHELRSTLWGASEVAHLFPSVVEDVRALGGYYKNYRGWQDTVEEKATGVSGINWDDQARMGHPIWWGRHMEPVVFEALNQLRNIPCMPWGELLQSKQHPRVGATPDGVCGKDALVEIKCVSYSAKYRKPWKEYLKDGVVPPMYRTQAMTQMAVTGADVCILAVVFGGRGVPTCIPVIRDDFWISLIFERCEEMWDKVEKRREELANE